MLSFNNILIMTSYFTSLAFLVVFLHISGIHADNEVLNKLESMSGRIGYIEETLGGFVDAVSKMERVYKTLGGLVDAVNKLEKVYECGWPKLAHGHFEGNSTYYRGVLRAFCDESYILKGKSKVRCKANGIWTKLPRCVASCVPPIVPNSVELDEPYYTIDSQISIKCESGYDRSGSETLVCLGNNMWSDTVVCTLIDCGAPEKERHGTYGDTYGTTFNSTISLTCDNGYGKVGPDVSRCIEKGYWDGEQTCLERVCIDITIQGTHTTECLLKQTEMCYEGGDSLGELHVPTADQDTCLKYCVETYPTYSYITMDNSWGDCACFKLSGRGYPNNFFQYDTYFREDISSEFSTYQDY